MSILARFRVLPKLFAIIVLLSAVAGAISYVGIHALGQLNDAAENMERAAARTLLAQRLTANVLAMNRDEYRLASDPRAETYRAARQAIDNEIAQFRERANELAKTIPAGFRSKLDAIMGHFSTYERELQGTYKAAEAIKSFQMTSEMERLREETASSAKEAATLRTQIRELATDLDREVETMAKHADEDYRSASRLILIAAGLGIALGLIGGFIVGQFGIVTPLRACVATLQGLAKGQFHTEIAGTDRKDEIGDVARTALVFRDNGLEKERLEVEQRANEARMQAEKSDAMKQLADSFEGAVGGIVDAVSSAAGQLQGAAQSMSSSAEETTHQSTAVAAASEEASANVQTVATAAEELSSSVAEIGRRVNESAQIASEAARDADVTAAKVARLSEAAQKIGDVVGLITTIAGQTNLLALNATIEAARAGEAGRGFAVVASEVKSLADQTTKATAEISAQIEEIQTSTADSANAIGQITETIRRMNEISTTIASAVEEQGAATAEIARNVAQASAGTAEVSSNINGVTRAASDSTAAAEQVLSSARNLATQSDVLKSEVGRFLATVRAA